MSKILRRPMFRGGGKVSSYGNGITAPLVNGYEGGGQIGGGIIYGKPTSDGRYGFAKPRFNAAEMTMPAPGAVTSGQELLSDAFLKIKGQAPMIPHNGISKEPQGETNDKGEIISTEIEDINFNNMSDEGIGGVSEIGETKTFRTVDQYIENPNDPNGPRITNPEWGNLSSFQKKFPGGNQVETEQKEEVIEGSDLSSANNTPPSMRNPSISGLPGVLPPPEAAEPTEISARDAIAENQELFKELLGSKQARGQDISDMLLRFSGSEGNTLGEKFSNYTRAEAAAGPGRNEKISQTAAGLAINDYIAGKRTKEQADIYKGKVDYEYGKKAEMLDVQSGDDVTTALFKIAKKTGNKVNANSDTAYKYLINMKTGSNKIYRIDNIKMKDLEKPKSQKKLKIGFNIIEEEGVKNIVTWNGKDYDIKTIGEIWKG
jgi:hypothetical protein